MSGSSEPRAPDFIDLMFREAGPGAVLELRALTKNGRYGKRTDSGYFDNVEAMREAAMKLDGKAQVYLTLNPVDPGLLARSNNRVIPRAGTTTADLQIVARRFLFVEFDPKRPADIPSTDAEHAAAIERAVRIADGLEADNWPRPILADSGNGAYLLYRVDLPNDDRSRDLLRDVLRGLSIRFADELSPAPAVELDTKVFNASRIARVIGTENKKGDGTSDRPHRRSTLLKVPAELDVVTREKLEAVAVLAPKPPDPKSRKAAPTAKARARKATPGGTDDPIRRRASAYLAKIPGAVEGQGGDAQTFRAALALVRGFSLSADVAFALLNEEYNSRCQPPWTEHELRHKIDEAGKSSLRDGYLLDDGPEDEAWASEVWFARQVVAEHGEDLRHVGEWGKWFAFDEPIGRWSEDVSGERIRRAEVVAGRLLAPLKAALELAREGGDEESIKAATAAYRAIAKYFNATGLENTMKVARAERPVIATIEQWDADPMLFACANGVIELQTGTFRPARREDYITKSSPVCYDPKATAPVFLQFLSRVMPDPEVRDYLQRFLGYTLTGLNVEHLLTIAWGGGSNGKTTLTEAVVHVLGDYAAPAPPALLMATRGDRHPTELAALHGKRLVCAAESPEGGKLNEQLVKSLTGGDRIMARRMREDYWWFAPTHKLLLATNHKPRIAGTDHGIWRRLRLVPFSVKIPDSEQDKALSAKLRAEGAGILNWLIAGCVAYQREGLSPPDAVKLATNEYREGEDVLGEFITDALVQLDGAFSSSADLHVAYGSWAQVAGIAEHHRMGQRTLTKKLSERGFQNVTSPTRGFKGLAIAEWRP